MEKFPAFEYGRPDLIEVAWGTDTIIGQKIAAIIAYSGHIEYCIERVIWKLDGTDPRGTFPRTDTKPITDLIKMLEKLVSSMPADQAKVMMEAWCAAALSGAKIRHNIAHGVPLKLGETLTFVRNPQWHGESRKREFGDFWADEHTLLMVTASLATLLRIIVLIEKGEVSMTELADPVCVKALREAKSILGEFSSRVEVP